ncbi:cytochrome c family protein [Puniceibacterium sp. IMCC21224]|uniref:c-type cytochrome n=1 Tax=Puniceibacterium sp. IMCC21224 TaxID=1618204 RepID=UPI00064DC60C|nr:cytochrome c family protein [Puniceibacterium sp. IMCC21224]KMK66769.1 cytochrome c2 [Puniceibacterium sp. IMCC21224]
MLDTMTMTKVLGGFCGALLIFLLGKWGAETIYHVGGGHGDHTQAYVIDTGSDDAASGDAPEVDFDTLLASADVAKGEKVFGKCRACHKLEDGANATGPYLYGVVGRAVDTAAGYTYSGALEKVVDTWTPENLSHFLESPRGFAPGTAMSFNGLPKAEDRANLIAYLDSTDD